MRGACRVWLSLAAAGVVASAVMLSSVGMAEAKLLDLYAGTHTGTTFGWADGSRGFALGFDVGAELLGVDAAVSFNQLFDGSGAAGTITQLALGIDTDIAIDFRRRPKMFLRLGGDLGFAIVTRQPVDLPLDEAQTSHLGPVTNALGALEYHFNRFLIGGLQFTGGYHYFARGGDVAQDESSDHVHGGQFNFLVTFRGHFDPFGL